MYITSRFGIAFFCMLALCACASDRAEEDFGKPTNLTVATALSDIATWFVQMKTLLRDSNMKMGFFPCKSIVTLNVTAGCQYNDKLVLNSSAKPATWWEKALIDASISAKGDFSSAINASMGNTVTFELYNVACLPKDTLAYDKPEKIKAAAEATYVAIENSPALSIQ